MKASYFVPYACCVPVKGHTRSLVADLQRGSFFLIPNVLADLLDLCPEKSVAELHAHFGPEHAEAIDGYLDRLVSEEYGFYSDQPSKFPRMDLDWRNPNPVTNAILDFGPATDHPLEDLGRQLSALGCQALQMRFFHALDLAALARHLEPFHDSSLRAINLLVGYHPSLDRESLQDLMGLHKRVKQVAVHSCPDEDRLHRVGLEASILYTREAVTSEACCGQVSSHTLFCNAEAFTEARHFNNCLNRKISVDQRGHIRNCPSMARSFGDVRQVPLRQALDQAAFREPWTITKDQVLVCRDCEFRYLCLDCRAHVQDPGNPLSKPAKCRYDPYEGRWA